MTERRPRVLLVDDGTAYAEVLNEMSEFDLIRPAGDDGAPCLEDGIAAIEFLEGHHSEVDVVLLDMHFDVGEDRLFELSQGESLRRTRRFQGVAILGEIRKRFPHLPVVLLTAVEDLSLVDAAQELTSQSMTYVLDGDDLDSLRVRINAALKESSIDVEESLVMWGSDPAMKAIRRRLTVLSRGRMPVILEGETGTGKSFLAERFVHVNSGRKGPFVVLDLSTLPGDLIPAHLFGSVKGAYTGAVSDRKGVFEMAHEGTLFIDEIQNVPLEVQKQLLLVLQDGRVRPLGSLREIAVDVKVVAASNRPLDEAVAEGSFRPDLYMRLSPATRVRIPGLAERLGDLGFLARRFAATAFRDPDIDQLRDEVAAALGMPAGTPLEVVMGRKKKGARPSSVMELVIPGPVWKLLLDHPWPGNMRELSMVMHNVVAFTLVATVDAIRSGMAISSPRLQVDPGLVGELLSGSVVLARKGDRPVCAGDLADDEITVRLESAQTLNAVANAVERQYFLELYRRNSGDFSLMAKALLADPRKGRAVRLRFNQLGLKVRELSR